MVIFSESAYQRECKTLLKNDKKESEKEAKEFEKLSSEVFLCPHDALKHLKKSHSRYQYIEVKEVEIVAVQKYPTLGA